MAVNADNPAGRLYFLLSKFNGVPSGSVGDTRDPYIKERLALTLEIDVDDNEELMYGLLEVHKLINDVEQSLNAKDGIDEDLYIAPLRRIRKAFSIVNMNTIWEGYKNHPTASSDLTSLKFISEFLSKSQAEKIVPEEELNQLLDDLNALYKVVLASSLEQELKVLILNQLEAIRRAIHNYRVRGYPALQEAMEKVAGSYFIHEALIDKERDKEEIKSYKSFLSRFVSTVSFAANTTKLIEAAAKWLPLLTSGDPPDIPPVE